MEHPNGKVYQQPDRVDIVAYDGSHRNNFMWDYASIIFHIFSIPLIKINFTDALQKCGIRASRLQPLDLL